MVKGNTRGFLFGQDQNGEKKDNTIRREIIKDQEPIAIRGQVGKKHGETERNLLAAASNCIRGENQPIKKKICTWK